MQHWLEDWDDIRLVLAVHRTGSFHRAAGAMGVDPATVSRRVGRMERRLGARLFDRNARGARTTPAGRIVVARGEEMETATTGIEGDIAGIDEAIAGPLRITTTEGIGIYWLGPRLLGLRRRHPNLEIEIDVGDAQRDLSRREADIAIRYGRPTDPRVRARRVADVPFRLFAARSYLDAHGRPGSLEELRHHHFISYALPLAGPLWDNWSRLRESGAGIAFRANTGHGVAIATEAGFGIGLLPRYTIELLPELEEIPLDVGPPLELWLMTDKDIGRTRKVRAAVDYIVDLFERERRRYFSP